VQPAQHLALVVGLAYVGLQPQVAAGADAQVGELGVGGGAVDLRLAGAEPVEVGAVEDEDLHAAEPTSRPSAAK
jgi:hypothetical protein